MIPPVLYEDRYFLAISKPCGVYCTSTGNPDNQTVKNLFPEYYLAHRLDAATSGVLLLAKTSEACHKISTLFRQREINKFYLAISDVVTHHEHSQTWKDKIEKGRKGKMRRAEESGLTAISEAKILPYKNKSILLLRPKTGRTHQIRIQSQLHDYPILGDTIYAKRHPHSRLMLHAYEMSFPHPYTSKNICIKSSAPKEFEKFLPRNWKLQLRKPFSS